MAARTEFFINGFGISRQVLLSNLPLYLGPEAICRPFTYQVCARRKMAQSPFNCVSWKKQCDEKANLRLYFLFWEGVYVCGFNTRRLTGTQGRDGYLIC